MKPSYVFRIAHELGQRKRGLKQSSMLVETMLRNQYSKNNTNLYKYGIIQTKRTKHDVLYNDESIAYSSISEIYHTIQALNPPDRNIDTKLEPSTPLQQNVYIGGDHSISTATLAHSIRRVKKPEDLKVVWIDAHADINSYRSSPTKSLHGMSLAYATFMDAHHKLRGLFDPYFSVDPQNILYVGLRSIDPYEKKFIEQTKIKTISVDAIRRSPYNAAKEIEEFTDNHPTHISLDVDVIDPCDFPCTGTPSLNGVRTFELCNMLCELKTLDWFRNVLALDLVEVNYLQGSDRDLIRSQHSLYSIIKTIL